MIDKATILKKGNAQPNVAIFARFAPYGREQAQWFVKQALDIGLMGVIFNGIDNREQALLAVRNMRYPQQRNSKYPEPPGLRGYAREAQFGGGAYPKRNTCDELTSGRSIQMATCWPS
jgi:hypothetical protein